ncbi:pilus assembly FimT family protein [Thalassotalea sp. ND16A]|uniref:pilus assembly FimT family protein n=1 Tax=Thalassotalea sp. ND16A TaxID=1535422 RepID=UPI00051A62B4|nr:type II secretion system protein [Thalassotalea sp. ND16A]KGJ98943.1 hypothetical protein ND16A_0465 [Thalassotalea sp. ND16A]
MASTIRRVSGFTIVELIVVVLIITILAITVVPKQFGSSSFDAFVYRDQMISHLRLKQQRAMQQTDSATCHQILIKSDGSGYGSTTDCRNKILTADWRRDNTGFEIPIRSNVLINSSSNETLTIDSWGRVLECSTQCIIEFTNAVDTARLCIEREGYIHAC